MKTSLVLVFIFFTQLVGAQHDFVTQCEGVWTGTMDIYSNGALLPNGPKVSFTVAPIIKDSTWTWRTDYDSPKYGVISKDYVLKSKDPKNGHYILDEGDGIVLDYQLNGRKMYSVFEVEDIVLTATYELRNDQLIFEVYSSPKSQDSTQVLSHRVQNVQRVRLLSAEQAGSRKQ